MDAVDWVLESLIVDFTERLRSRQRTYDEVIEAWRTSCPRLAVWDEANSGGILTIVEVADRSAITATSLGRYCWNDVGKMPDSWLPEVTVLL